MTTLTKTRKTAFTLTVVLATIAALAVLAITGQERGDAAAPRGAKFKLEVVERNIVGEVVDNPPMGDSLGDTLTFKNPIFNRSNKKRIGFDQGTCVRTDVGIAWECSFTTHLREGDRKGSIVVQGAYYDDLRPSRFTVLGGTGDYRGVTGHLVISETDGPVLSYAFIFTLWPTGR